MTATVAGLAPCRALSYRRWLSLAGPMATVIECGALTGTIKLHEAQGATAAISATVMDDARVILSR